MKTTLYAGFPGIGKTYMFNNFNGIILDNCGMSEVGIRPVS